MKKRFFAIVSILALFGLHYVSTAQAMEKIGFVDTKDGGLSAKQINPPQTITLPTGKTIFLPRQPVSRQTTRAYKEGEALVKLKSDSNALGFKDKARGKGFSVKKELKSPGRNRGRTALLLQSSTISAIEMVKIMQNDPAVELVSLNYLHTVNVAPNDPLYSEQWGLKNIGQAGGTPGVDIDAESTWDIHTGSTVPVAAVLDTGVTSTHPDLQDNMWVNTAEAAGTPGVDDDGNGYVDDIHGYDFAYNDGEPDDEYGHGTHVAGTIGATGNNATGVTGVAWDGSIMALKFIDDTGNGSDDDLIDSINYVTAMKLAGVNVVAINASFGGGGPNPLLKDAIDQAGAEGIIFVAAAGNTGANNDATPFYPCSFESTNIIGVAATDRNDNRPSFSSYGLTSVDLGAPGQDIHSTYSGRSYTSDPADLFYDNFDPGAVGWSGDPNWQLTEEESQSPTHAWTDSPGVGVNSANNSTTTLLTPPIDLSYVPSRMAVGFDVKCDLQAYHDYLNIYFKEKLVLGTGSWAITTDTANSPDHSWSDSPGGNYANEQENWLASPVIDLSSTQANTALHFNYTGRVEADFDYFNVYMSPDNGTNWDKVTSLTGDYSADWHPVSIPIDTAYRTDQFRFALTIASDALLNYDGMHVDDVVVDDNDNGAITTFFSDDMESGNGGWETFAWTGGNYTLIRQLTGSWGWWFYPIQLDERYNHDSFQVAFTLYTDNDGITGDGVYIDNFSVGESLWVDTYGNMSGTSMATPHVTGAIALLAAQYPNETLQQRMDRILNTVDPVSALDGKTVTGGRLNLYNAMKDNGFKWEIFFPAIVNGAKKSVPVTL